MNTLNHEFRFESPAQWRARVRRHVRDGFAAIAAAVLLAVILIMTGLLRLLALPSSHAAIAEALHRVGEAMGPPF
jgi:hypothetical protein